MRFCVVSEVPEMPVFTRLFDLFATDMLANFQDRLVMTTSTTSCYKVGVFLESCLVHIFLRFIFPL